jgi:hypothetical protein
MTVNTRHTVRLDVVTSNTVFREVQRVSAEGEVSKVTSGGSTKRRFYDVRQAGARTLCKGHVVSPVGLSIDIPADINWYHVKGSINVCLFSFSITDGYDSASLTYICRGFEGFHNLVCKIVTSGRTATFGDITLNSEEALIIHLWVNTTDSRFSTSGN